MKVCSTCGETLLDNVQFCPNCGAPANDQPTPEHSTAGTNDNTYTNAYGETQNSNDAQFPFHTPNYYNNTTQTPPPQAPYPPEYSYEQSQYNQTPLYPQQNYYQNVPQQQTDGKGIAGLVLGILSLFFSCLYGSGLIFAIIGLCLSVASRNENQEKYAGSNNSYGMATAGMVCSIIGLVLSILMILYFILVVFTVIDTL